MLNKEVIELLNNQIWLENRASFFYLRLSVEFNKNGYFGISKFFLNQSNEERD
jgi:ferritin